MKTSDSSRVIIINGPAGVGKTTVGRMLAGLWTKGVCIHGDHIRDFIVTTVPSEVEGQLGYKNAATLATNYLSAGYSVIVVDYIFEHIRHVKAFLRFVPLETPIYLFTLWAPLSVVIEREAHRIGRQPLGVRVQECYEAISANLNQLGLVVATEGVEPDVVAHQIYAMALDGKGNVVRHQL